MSPTIALPVCGARTPQETKTLPDLSGPALKQNSTSHLVVCGAIDYKRDHWLFGDFLGFVDTFKKATPPIHGDFVNVHRTLSLAAEKSLRYDHREAWWTQVNEPSWRSVKSDILRWIESRVCNAKPGDIVTIVLIKHENTDGIFIGGLPLSPSELATACANFAADVQVNIIIKACSSGAFANAFRVSGQRNLYVHTSSKDRHEKSFSDRRSISGRVRNSLFGSSFIETLGLMRDEEEIWTLGKQKQKLAYDLDNPRVPELRRSHPQVASDSPLKRIMWDIMYRDYIDLSFDHAPTNARREMEGLDTDFPEGGDIGILDQLFALDRFPKARRHSAVEELVRTLSYRFRVQEEIFIIAESLMHLGLLSYQSLYLPMELSRGTPSVHTVVQSLECFDYVASTMSFLDGRGAFDTPAMWLATVMSGPGPRFTVNPREGEAKEVLTPQYGVWLPHGVSMKDFAVTFSTRYCAIKEAYDDLLGEGTWGDSSMLEAAVTRILAAERLSPDSGYGTTESQNGFVPGLFDNLRCT
ncbi:hypothetical protein V8E54_009057 [Elaphomyces granulatus]